MTVTGSTPAFPPRSGTPAEPRRDAENLEIVGRDGFARERHHVIAGAEPAALTAARGDRAEGVGFLLKILIRRIAQRPPLVGVVDEGELVRRRHGERTHEKRVDQAEDGGVDADGKAEHQDRGDGERRTLRESADTVAEVGKHA